MEFYLLSYVNQVNKNTFIVETGFVIYFSWTFMWGREKSMNFYTALNGRFSSRETVHYKTHIWQNKNISRTVYTMTWFSMASGQTENLINCTHSIPLKTSFILSMNFLNSQM